ncbi:DUF1822 family protein [Pleurocapsa sp. PCC 7319]|uniref:DUF1822 family protein n=1 Tax=Pleurocapsa sp. PCC 7319 TaxID=118161 RepID=UPI00034B3DC9|nr:DUF1822 family protein [Pleurocapsa sp. PCC 7319]
MNLQSEIFQQITIPAKARIKAEQFRRYQSQGTKAKQVYLNTLAVFIANYYLNSLGWATNLESSDSWNPIFQTMMDVADLQIPNCGKLECRVVLNHQDTVTIPPEVWYKRIGYLVIRLDESLSQGTLLGFIPEIKQVELPLNQLESLAQFPAYLNQQKSMASVQSVSLSRWLSGALDCGWYKLEELLLPPIALNFRSPPKVANQHLKNLSTQVSRVKLVRLENISHDIALVLNIQPERNDEFNISVTVCHREEHQYLPEGLELVILDEVMRPVMIAQANQTETIEFCFSGKLRESFSVELSLDENIKVESFII